MNPPHFETRAVHSGEHRAGAEEGGDGAFYPISTPIYASTTFSHPNVETTDRVLGGGADGRGHGTRRRATLRLDGDAPGAGLRRERRRDTLRGRLRPRGRGEEGRPGKAPCRRR